MVRLLMSNVVMRAVTNGETVGVQCGDEGCDCPQRVTDYGDYRAVTAHSV